MESFLSLGRLHIPVYGLFAAAGLMCAMLLGQRTARLAHVDPDAFWDAGMVMVFSAFVTSRLILVAENFRIFLQYPMLVLELPSIAGTGETVTAILLFLYLRHRRIPLLNAMDAAAPCTALLWAFFNLGSIAAGNREGMPSTVPWVISSSFGHVHPVEAYSAIAWALFCVALLWLLQRSSRTGETAALGLILGGLLLFFLDFFRLPELLYGASPVDGVQRRALVAMTAGSLLLAWILAPSRTPNPRDTEDTKDTKGLGDAV